MQNRGTNNQSPKIRERVWFFQMVGSTVTTVLPACFLSNFTLPEVKENNVWSLPMPTLSPGWYLVPRWRTKIFPETTGSPPYFFTPNLLPAVSRPFREEPPAFLCAIQTSFKRLIFFGCRLFSGRFFLNSCFFLSRYLFLCRGTFLFRSSLFIWCLY